MDVITKRDLPWHALYVNYKAEKKVCYDLQRLGIESFLPLYTKVRFYREHKRKSKIPLISCYVFVKVPNKQRGVVRNIKGVVKFVRFGNEPSIIPPKEIDLLKRIVGLNSDLAIENHNYFEIGEDVCVKYGPLAGMEGQVFNKRGKDRILLKIHSLHQAISVEVNCDLLESVNKLLKENN